MHARRVVVFALIAVAAVTSGALLAQAPQAVGTWVSGGDIGTALPNGAAVTLTDGRTLITGGLTAQGVPTADVIAFNPVDRSVVAAGSLAAARSGHTATLLSDGRVLISGGVTDGGLISSDLELFDPATSTSTIVAQLPEPRTKHVAAALLDGTVLIAGGSTTGDAILRSAVVFDPVTFGLTPVTNQLQLARVNASATTLLDGRVLIAGGSDGTSDLASAEVFERYSQTFITAASQMIGPRQGHSAILLPNNGGVLVVGGSSNGVAQGGTDLFLPAVFPDPFSYGEGQFMATGAMAVPRASAVAGSTSVEGFAFAAGGGATGAEVYRFATIKTDKDDYAPGQLADITGAGWQPGEEVTLLFQEAPAVHDDYVLKVTADGAGNISWTQWAPEPHDLGVRFYLTATGSASRAQTTFTDATATTTTVVTSPNPSTPGQSVTATATVTAGTTAVTQGVVRFFFGGANCSGNPGTSFGPAGGVALDASGQASASTTLLTNGITVRACYDGFGSGSSALQSSIGTVVQTVTTNVATTMVVSSSANASTFGGSVTFSAAVTRSSGTGTPTGSVQFTIDGSNFGAPVSLGAPSSPTLATATSAAITSLTAGTHTVAATYIPTGNFVASSDTLDGGQVVNKSDAVCTITGFTGAYDAAAHGATGSCAGVPGDPTAAGSSLSLGASFTNVPGGTANWSFTGGANYNNQSGSVAITITKADAACTISGYSGTYDAAPHGATGSCRGVGTDTAAAGSTLSLGASFTNAAGGSANWSFTGGTNYKDQSGSVAITISKANASCTVNGYTGTFDAAAHGATGSCAGVGTDTNAAGGTLSLGATFTNVPGGTAHWSFTGGANYNDQSGSAAVVINKATAVCTISGYTGNYDAAAHGAAGSCAGVGTDTSAAGSSLTLGATFTNVPGGTADWSFTGGGNYNDQSGSVAIVIDKADAVCTINGFTGPFDGAAHGASGSCAGVAADPFAAGSSLNLGSSFTNVPGGTANWTFTGGTNYKDQASNVSIDITRADAVCTITGFTGPFDAASHGATGSCLGVEADRSAVGSSLNLGATFTNAPGGTANWQFTGGINYNNQSGSAAIVISKADAVCTITGFTGPFDAASHGATGSCAGVPADPSAFGSSLNLGSSFTNAPGGTADWQFTGGTNYKDQASSVAIVITKADAVCMVSGYTGVYDAASHSASGSCVGIAADLTAAGSSLNLGGSFTDVPGGTAHWAFTGGTNYNDQSGSVLISITKADAVCTIGGYAGVYDGSSHGATGSCTGVNNGAAAGGTLDLGATYKNVPGGTATWVFTGGTNYNNQTSTVTIAISKANAVCTIAGYTGIYDGQAHGATGSCAGVDAGGAALGSMLGLGTSFTNVPGGTATWVFHGGTNYNNQGASVAITIGRAEPTVSVSGYTGVYDAVAHGATGTATGVSNETLAGLSLGASFTNVPGGTAHWVFTDVTGNYNNASGDVAITISKANATITVNGYTGTFDNAPHGATGSAAGVGGVNLSAGLSLGSSFTNVPGGTAHWTFAGGTNYNDAAGDVLIVIIKANAACTVFSYDVIYDGVFHTATGSCTGVNSVVLSGLNLTATSHKDAGDYLDAWTFVDVTGNYNDANGTVDDKIRHWTTDGFYQPVDMGGTQNSIKGGSTVPLKFNLFAGSVKKTSTTDVKSFAVGEIGCSSSALEADVEFTTTGGTSLRYDGTAGQFIQNWQTPKTSGRCYMVRLTAQDGSTIDAYFKTK